MKRKEKKSFQSEYSKSQAIVEKSLKNYSTTVLNAVFLLLDSHPT